MRVKRLDLFGFKSFANKTAINFEPGVTAIVGPNGSGKSNVVDAIRWVLGEHNPRDVRAPRLEDVIFNGTDQRAPLSIAEVTLTISNEQGLLPINFTEVAVTRRVYRSGESECLINQAPCRLRDIQELFLGTGLGGGTYAIIEQGHIDMVLSSKPEERRVVFEEASGIAKYLAKKKETMRRLDEAEEHLVRIVDIISEVRRQVNALERQANKARQYKSQWEHLKQLELRLAVDELRAGQSRFGDVERQAAALSAQRQELEAQKQSCVSAIEERNAAVSALQAKLQELRAQLAACASQIEQHDGQAALKQGWIEELKQQAVQLEQETVQLASRTSGFDEQLARVGGGETELTAQDAELRTQLHALDADMIGIEQALTTALETITQVKTQLFEAASDATHQRNTVAQLSARLQTSEAQAGRLEGQWTQLGTRTQDVLGRRTTAQHDREQLQAQYDESQQRAIGAAQALEAAAVLRHELVGRMHQAREQLAAERSRVGMLEDLWRRYEGFPDAVRSLMSGAVQGIIGPLADLLQAAPGYEDVVEAALGPLSDALVVRDRASLARCREHLREHGFEGGRFLVLEDCPSETPQMAAAGVGAVKQYVRADAAYQRLVDWLLDDACLVENFDQILHDRTTPSARLVSRQGERWDRRSWRLGVGSRAQSSTNSGQGMGQRLGRKQRWEAARAGLQAVESQFVQLEADARGAEHEWQRLLGEQEAAKAAVAHAQPGLQKLTAQIEQLVQEAARVAEEQRGIAMELEELTAERQRAQEALAAARQATAEAETRQQTLERALADAQTARETTAQRHQELSVGHAQADARLRALEERLGSLRTRRQELEAERGHLTTQVEQKQRQRTEGLARVQDLEQQVVSHRQERETRAAEQARLDAEAAQLAESVREAEGRRDDAVPKLLEVNSSSPAWSSSCRRFSSSYPSGNFGASGSSSVCGSCIRLTKRRSRPSCTPSRRR